MTSTKSNGDYVVKQYEEWWNVNSDPSTPGQRGTIATLRRARNTTDILMVPQALKLVTRFHEITDSHIVTIGVLSHVRENSKKPIMCDLGVQPNGTKETAKLKEVRFRRLIETSKRDLLDPMRRLIHLNNNQANVHNLCRVLLYWGETIKKELIYQYYGVAQFHSDQENQITTQ